MRSGLLYRALFVMAIGGLALVMASVTAGLDGQPAGADDNDERFFLHDLTPHQKDCSTCHVSTGASGKFKVKTATFGGGGAHSGPPIACDDAGCHANEKWTGPGVPISNPFCFNCHAHKPQIWPRVRSRGFGSYVLDSFSHEVHMKRASNDCSTCHQAATFRNKKIFASFEPTKLQRDMSMPGHAECAQCHHKKERGGGFFVQPEVTKDCEACHATSPESVEKSTFIERSKYSVAYSMKLQTKKVGRSTFVASDWHAQHAKKSRNNGKDCMLCHQNAATSPGFVVPMPEKAACETCHNGKTAFGRNKTVFSVLGSECGRCHVPSP